MAFRDLSTRRPHSLFWTQATARPKRFRLGYKKGGNVPAGIGGTCRHQVFVMAEMTRRIDPAIELDLGDNPGKVSFATYNELLSWAEQEVAAWRALADHRETLPPLTGDPALQRQQAVPSQIVSIARQALATAPGGDLSDIHRRAVQSLNRYRQMDCIHHRSVRGRMVLHLMETDPAAAIAMLAAYTRMTLTVADRGRRVEHDLMPLLHALARATVVEQGGPTALRAEHGAFVTMRNEWNKRLAGKQQDLEDAVIEITGWLAQERADMDQLHQQYADLSTRHTQAIDDYKASLAALERDYAARLSLRSSAGYWSRKRIGHRLAAAIAGLAFPAIAAGIIYAVFWFATVGEGLVRKLPGLRDVTADAALSPAVITPVAGTIVIGLIILFGIWILQLVSRFFFANLSLMSDAGERVAMVETFLALTREDDDHEVTAERALVLQALFRPGRVTQFENPPLRRDRRNLT